MEPQHLSALIIKAKTNDLKHKFRFSKRSEKTIKHHKKKENNFYDVNYLSNKKRFNTF